MESFEIRLKEESEPAQFEPEKVGIIFDSNLRRWFSRNLGIWRSRRQYFFDEEEVINLEMFLRIEQVLPDARQNAKYRFSWWSENENNIAFFKAKPKYKKEGVIMAELRGHQLYKDSNYLCNSSVISNIRQVDEHELIFESHYENWDVLEHTRLIDQDKYRYRSIYSWDGDQLKIVENHHETKMHSD